MYCGFFQNQCNPSAEDDYIDLLIKEIERTANSNYVQSGLVHSVFLGGGTPSALSAENITRLLKTIRARLPLANDCELTLEGRIHDLVEEKMDAWFANGVNRISIGVQSFDTKLRQQIGRLDDADTVINRLKAAAAYQQASVVVDLIYGLPDQSMELWERDLEILDALPIDGMDLYQLNVYEHSDLNKAIQENKISPAATTAMQREMFVFAKKWLDQRPYKRLSNCHWAKHNRERSLYNTLNKIGVDLIPFGCGAGGKIGAYSFMTARNLAMYRQMITEEKKPLMGIGQRVQNYGVYDLVTAQLEQGYICLSQILAIAPDDLQDLAWLVQKWEAMGVLEYNGVLYKLTVNAQFWIVNITQTLLECIQYLLEKTHKVSMASVSAQG